MKINRDHLYLLKGPALLRKLPVKIHVSYIDLLEYLCFAWNFPSEIVCIWVLTKNLKDLKQN